jgi:hypothetical protein
VAGITSVSHLHQLYVELFEERPWCFLQWLHYSPTSAVYGLISPHLRQLLVISLLLFSHFFFLVLNYGLPSGYEMVYCSGFDLNFPNDRILSILGFIFCTGD